MKATDISEKRSDYPDLGDLRWVPLEDMPSLSDDVLGSVLRRLVPDPTDVHVPVAAFNSAI
jgi:FXSXX-COOH protein